MELIAKQHYFSAAFSLNPGETTIGRNLTDAEKQHLLADQPDWFELLPESKDVVEITTPEDSFVIETPEAKLGKIKRK